MEAGEWISKKSFVPVEYASLLFGEEGSVVSVGGDDVLVILGDLDGRMDSHPV
jgi:hypothetical protein